VERLPLFQESPRHFAVWKRTTDRGCWLKHAGRGQRASGFGYVGGVSGGLGVGMRDFWQRFPRSLDVRGAATGTATVTLWSYSPQAPPMDLRRYDTVAHGLDLSYEDVQEGFGTPQGMMRSTDMQLWAFAGTPSRDTIAALAPTLTAPPQLVAAPETLLRGRVFGRWSLPDRSTPARAALEDSIAADVAFYAGQVDQREWYGFWHYGDVMHTYDADRHEWRYDVGGYAWDNAELGTDAMLWYAFLRSGHPGTFRLARAMTTHVSEVDEHHTGRFAGLGSRHAVVHWGDGAKEARVSESFTKRFCYYLIADELLGDLIRTSLRADDTLRTIDPLREVLPPQQVAPARVRIGPDWYALVSNWLTEWERTGDTRWRDRIVTGMRDIATFPAGLFTGEAGRRLVDQLQPATLPQSGLPQSLLHSSRHRLLFEWTTVGVPQRYRLGEHPLIRLGREKTANPHPRQQRGLTRVRQQRPMNRKPCERKDIRRLNRAAAHDIVASRPNGSATGRIRDSSRNTFT
jgi:hypothetical protein